MHDRDLVDVKSTLTSSFAEKTLHIRSARDVIGTAFSADEAWVTHQGQGGQVERGVGQASMK